MGNACHSHYHVKNIFIIEVGLKQDWIEILKQDAHCFGFCFTDAKSFLYAVGFFLFGSKVKIWQIQ